jgi:serine/threonine protein kinase
LPELPLAAFQLGAVLGAGNFGKVFAGSMFVAGGALPCAIKVPTPIDGSSTEGAKQAHAEFLEEVDIMVKLTCLGGHPNIVAALGVHKHSANSRLAIELCEGGDLKSLLAAERGSPPEAVRQMHVCEAGLKG